MKINNKKDYLILHLLILFLSLSGVFSKMASSYAFLSIKFCFFYGLVLLILFVYAIVWQQILKSIPLSTAYCNKSISIIWGMILGLLVFGEPISIQNIIGACIVFIGVYLVVTADE